MILKFANYQRQLHLTPFSEIISIVLLVLLVATRRTWFALISSHNMA